MDKTKNSDKLPYDLTSLSAFTGERLTCILVAVVVSLVLAGCASVPSTTYRAEEPLQVDHELVEAQWSTEQLPSTLAEALKQANPFVYNGNNIPSELAIQIIELCNQEKSWDSVEATTQNVSADAMTTDQFARYTLALLSAWQTLGELEKIDSWLNSSLFLKRFPLMDTEQQVALSLARADYLLSINKPLDAARERVFIHDFIDNNNTKAENLQAILQSVLSIEESSLQTAAQGRDNKLLQGWLEFALVSRDITQAKPQQELAVQRWKQRWKKHPANHFAVSTKKAKGLLNPIAFSNSPGKLGVFLPLSGKLEVAGKALRDGLMNAYFETTNNLSSEAITLERDATLPSVRFYDTAVGDMAQLYAQARTDGITAIIGPLQKSNVQAFFTMPTSVPVLALNFISNGMPPPNNIVQFGLATEDEAQQIAQYALKQGYHKPLLLVSDKDWSQRAARVFNDTWRAERGVSAVVQPLSIQAQFSAEVASGLGLPLSEARHKSLQTLLGDTLEYKPRRRQDVDYIVLFANSDDAKAINPLLDYHYAADLPVFASSHVFDSADNAHQVDLNGIIFSEIPWLIQKKLQDQKAPAPSSTIAETELLQSKTQQRLYAMGQDAFHLYSRIDQLSLSPGAQWLANTGKLSIKDQRVIRELPLVQFQRGAVAPLN